MLDMSGHFLLILMWTNYGVAGSGGLAVQEVDTFDDCKAAQVQLEPIKNMKTVCIAKQVMKDKDDD